MKFIKKKEKTAQNEPNQRRPGVGVGGQGSQSDLSVGPLSLQRYLFALLEKVFFCPCKGVLV